MNEKESRAAETDPNAHGHPWERDEPWPSRGHLDEFTQDEVRRAFELFMPPDQAAALAENLYVNWDHGLGWIFPERLLFALAIVADGGEERVRPLLNLPHEALLEAVTALKAERGR